MGKNSARNQAHEQSRLITSEYSKGLKFLLDREEDQGLEHLIKLLEVSADSVEHYLTLATMFRKRGELDRAIKIHELLLKQPSLNAEQIASSRLELAQDYIMAGLLDSAEQHLLGLVKSGEKAALDPLLSLYQQTREWNKGIRVFEAHGKLFVKKQQLTAMANFYCEEGLLEQNNEMLKKASALGEKSIRPLYELGLSAFDKSDYVKAIYYWRELLQHFPHFAPLFIEKLETSYHHLNLTEQFDELLEKMVPKGGVCIQVKYCQSLLAKGQVDKAIEFLTVSLKKQPNIRGFRYLLQLLSEKNAQVKDVVDQIDKLITTYIATKPDYQCQHCGFSSRSLYWSCPSCKHWESIMPSRGLDGF